MINLVIFILTTYLLYNLTWFLGNSIGDIFFGMMIFILAYLSVYTNKIQILVPIIPYSLIYIVYLNVMYIYIYWSINLIIILFSFIGCVRLFVNLKNRIKNS